MSKEYDLSLIFYSATLSHEQIVGLLGINLSSPELIQVVARDKQVGYYLATDAITVDGINQIISACGMTTELKQKLSSNGIQIQFNIAVYNKYAKKTFRLDTECLQVLADIPIELEVDIYATSSE